MEKVLTKENGYMLMISLMLQNLFIERGKLIFYNQFNFKNQNYIKYIILTFEEFNHDRKKSKIYIVESSQNFKRINNEMKKYFNNINLYKKSIFEIIQNYYE